jgi:hypothetical protein
MLTQIEIREFMKNAFPGKNRSVAFSDEIRAPSSHADGKECGQKKRGEGAAPTGGIESGRFLLRFLE